MNILLDEGVPRIIQKRLDSEGEAVRVGVGVDEAGIRLTPLKTPPFEYIAVSTYNADVDTPVTVRCTTPSFL